MPRVTNLRFILGATFVVCLVPSLASPAPAASGVSTSTSKADVPGSGKDVTMTFRREDYRGSGCLEYSWVPQGRRHDIVLAAGKATDVGHDQIPQGLHPSHVQVYALTNGKKTSPPWQFPPGPPHGSEVVSATVDVAASGKVTGTVEYADGSRASGDKRLDDTWRKCPTGLAPPEKSTR